MPISHVNPTVCIVIPCYRAALHTYERIALQRCIDVLGRHEMALITPASFRAESLLSKYPSLRCEKFADEYFQGVGGYNRLMLADEFYAQFARYDYILIYQLDAFVFSDTLLEWCSRDYDYVGAPWIPNARMPTRLYDLRNGLKRTFYRWMNRQDRHGRGVHFAQYKYSTGNGGLSLRRVEAMRSALAALPHIAARYRRLEQPLLHEDLFFCVEANRYRQRVKVPSYRVAAGFAWEQEPAVASALNQGKLPFGCHGWNKLHRDEWRPIFAKLGYALDEILSNNQT